MKKLVFALLMLPLAALAVVYGEVQENGVRLTWRG